MDPAFLRQATNDACAARSLAPRGADEGEPAAQERDAGVAPPIPTLDGPVPTGTPQVAAFLRWCGLEAGDVQRTRAKAIRLIRF
jgi:hypothetical protein